MNIEYIKTIDVIPYRKNAKLHPQNQVEKIAKSIAAFGFNQPIVVDKNNVIIAGHGRYEAARFLGLAEAPIVRLENLSAQQIKAYRLADNKLNESEWNIDLVIEDLSELDTKMQELTGFDLERLKLNDLSDSGGSGGASLGGLQQFKFILSDEQAEKIKEALQISKKEKDQWEYFGNDDENGNALFFIINDWIAIR